MAWTTVWPGPLRPGALYGLEHCVAWTTAAWSTVWPGELWPRALYGLDHCGLEHCMAWTTAAWSTVWPGPLRPRALYGLDQCGLEHCMAWCGLDRRIQWFGVTTGRAGMQALYAAAAHKTGVCTTAEQCTQWSHYVSDGLKAGQRNSCPSALREQRICQYATSR